MTRFTFVAFLCFTGFFYVTGKPDDESRLLTTSFADLAMQNVARQAENNNQPKYLAPSNMDQSAGARPDAKKISPPPAADQKINAARLEAPTRNPRRVADASRKYAKPIPVKKPAPRFASLKAKRAAAANAERVIGEARNKLTNSSGKSLAVSYQQRFVKPKKRSWGRA